MSKSPNKARALAIKARAFFKSFLMKISKMEANEQAWFCSAWPQARTVLQAIKNFSGNIFVKGACTVIIAVGNTAESKICGNSQMTVNK